MWYLHTPAETQLCYSSVLANGASVWYGIHGSTNLLADESIPYLPAPLVHLANYTGGMVRPLEKVAPLPNVQVQFHAPVQRVETLVSGTGAAEAWTIQAPDITLRALRPVPAPHALSGRPPPPPPQQRDNNR